MPRDRKSSNQLAPIGLQRDLREAYGAPPSRGVAVPSDLLETARAKAGARGPSPVRLWTRRVALAAVLAVLMFRQQSPGALHAGDIDGNGVVDIADVHRLALALRSGELYFGGDVNRDGYFDEDDVRYLLAAAVRLGPS